MVVTTLAAELHLEAEAVLVEVLALEEVVNPAQAVQVTTCHLIQYKDLVAVTTLHKMVLVLQVEVAAQVKLVPLDRPIVAVKAETAHLH